MSSEIICDMSHESNYLVNIHYHSGAFKEHIHTHWEICLNISNESFHYINSKKYHLHQNCVLLVKPSDIHKIEDATDKKHISLTIEISIEFLKTFCSIIHKSLYENLLNEDNLFSVLPNELSSSIIKYIASITHENVRLSTANNQGYIRNIASTILSYFILEKASATNCNIDSNLNTTNKTLASILQKMQKPEMLKLSFKNFCKEINYSEGHIIRIFKSNGLSTPNKIFIEYKLLYACKLLDTTNLQTYDICDLIGFESYSYFCKIFKQKFQMTPLAFKKRNIKQ